MPISTVRREARAKSPIISTANQVNAKTTAKKKSNKQGEVVAAIKDRVQRINVGCRVFSERSKLIKIVKQGDPAYEIINNVGTRHPCCKIVEVFSQQVCAALVRAEH